MKTAAIDITVEILASVFPVLADAGLRVIGSLDAGVIWNDPALDVVRLVLADEFGLILPAECEESHARPGLPMVRITMLQESYGTQKLVKVGSAELAGYLTRDRKVVPAGGPSLPDVEQEAAKARAAAILRRVTEGV